MALNRIIFTENQLRINYYNNKPRNFKGSVAIISLKRGPKLFVHNIGLFSTESWNFYADKLIKTCRFGKEIMNMKLFEPKIIYFDFEVFKGTGICIETVQHF